MFFKNLQNSQESTFAGVFFNKVAGSSTGVNIVIFKTIFLIEYLQATSFVATS